MDILVAGAVPGDAAGLSVMTATLVDALQPLGTVHLLTHRPAPWASLSRNGGAALPTMTLGVQPLCVHGEAIAAGWLHRGAMRSYTAGWAVGSRFAEALRAAAVPYAIWEATTLRDELSTIDVAEVRSAGRGTGIGAWLHKSLLPLDERLEGRLYRSAVAVFTLSDYTAGRIRTLHALPEDRVRILPPPPSPKFFASLERVRRGSIAADATPQSAIRLLTVGRVDDPRKNFALLRDAYITLRTAGAPASLTVVGPYSDAWRRSLKLDAVSGITFTGSVAHGDLPRLLLEHDALVVSSRQEGFGIVVAEAMHAGLPVISTRCGGPEQVLRESGGGVLVGHSVDELASAIARLAADPPMRVAMGARGRAYAERELSTARFYARVADAHELLRSKSSVKSRRTAGADA